MNPTAITRFPLQAAFLAALGTMLFPILAGAQSLDSVCASRGHDAPIVATVTMLGNVRIECHAIAGFPESLGAQIVRLAPNWRKDPRTLLDLRQQVSASQPVQSGACAKEEGDTTGHEARFRWVCLDAAQKLSVTEVQEALLVLTAPGRKETVIALSTNPQDVTVKDSSFSGLSGAQFDIQAPFQFAAAAAPSRGVIVRDESGAYQEFVAAGEHQSSGERKLCPADAPAIPDDNAQQRPGCRLVAGLKSYAATAYFNKNDPGKVKVVMPRRVFRDETATISIEGLGMPVRGKVVVGSPSKSVKDSDFYLKLLDTASKGSKPGLGLDGKLSHDFDLTPSITFSPLATANVGLRNQDSQDSVAFEGDFRYTHLGDFSSTQRFPGWHLTGAPRFETDKEFDRANLLARVEFSPIISQFFLTREMRTQIKANNAALPVSAVRPARYGRGLQVFLAVETGGSLMDVTQSSGSHHLTIPTYSIIRLAPELTGFVEYARLTLTVDSTLRFLLNDELSAAQQSNGSLLLRRVSGFRPLSKGTLEWGFDQAKHTSLVVAYTNGYTAPRFDHHNQVQTGVAFRY